MSSWAKKKPQLNKQTNKLSQKKPQLNKQTNKQKQNEIQHQEKCLFTQLFRPIKLVCIKPGKRPVILEMISCWSFVMHGLTKPFIKKKGQNTTKKITKLWKLWNYWLKKLLVFFFVRQGLSGPYQIRSSSSSDMNLIILVLWKKILIINIYMCVKIITILPLSTIFLLEFETVPTVVFWYFLFFI